jgi:DNA processing protein
MITINFATDQNRDVFAVPGSIYSPLSAMPNRLIVDGAYPVISAWEILDHYHWAEKPERVPDGPPAIELDDTEKSIVIPLTEQELSFDEIMNLTQIPPSKLNSHLTMLELRGIIVKVPGGLYRAYL